MAQCFFFGLGGLFFKGSISRGCIWLWFECSIEKLFYDKVMLTLRKVIFL